MRLFYLMILLLVYISPMAWSNGQTDVSRLDSSLKTLSKNERVMALNNLSNQLKEKDTRKAKAYAEEAYKLSKELEFHSGLMSSAFFLGELEYEAKHYRRAARKLEESVEAARIAMDRQGALEGLELLKTIYILDRREKKWRDTQSDYLDLKKTVDLETTSKKLSRLRRQYAYVDKELELSEAEKDKLSLEKELVEDSLAITIEEKERREAQLAREKAELEKEAAIRALQVSEQEKAIMAYDTKLRRQQQWQILLSLGLVSTILIIGLIIRNYKLKQRSEAERLSMQQQLFVHEKMATLGQITAGIAHEIKNPLNFVNNFAEGSSELAEELVETLAQNKTKLDADQFSLAKELTEDIRQNALDILANGKRADRIVQSMMQHARGDKGTPELTNINNLVADNMNLAYHGYRALYPSFKLEVKTDFDEALPMVKLIPQDLSRVILNIINNACYALNKKLDEKKNGFNPCLSLHTKKEKEELLIRIRDNGPGIPEGIRKEIFNPFFTTKPTGDGNAGLGLSISYDIVVQGLGGKLEVESELDQFTTFVIRLPLTSKEN